MSDSKQEQPTPANANGSADAGAEADRTGASASSAASSSAASSASASSDAPAAGEPDPFKVLEALQAENVELKDRWLRAQAEMENLRRRTEREVTDAKAYGVTSFARDMLTFADNLRRAIEAVPAEAREASDASVRTFVEGIELTERDFLSRLNRFGVKRMEPQGKRFDPNHHEVLFEMPDESVASGTVVQVVEPGYTIGERVLRAAKVGVSRGGPKA